MSPRFLVAALMVYSGVCHGDVDLQPCRTDEKCDDDAIRSSSLVQKKASRTKVKVAIDVCTNIDGDKKFDAFQGSCFNYDQDPTECSKHDDEDFIAAELCCACGGGKHESLTDAGLLQESASDSVSTGSKLVTNSLLLPRSAGAAACTCDICGADSHFECTGPYCPYLRHYVYSFTQPTREISINGVPLRCKHAACPHDPPTCNGRCNDLSCSRACGMCNTEGADAVAATTAEAPAEAPSARGSAAGGGCVDNTAFRYYGHSCDTFASSDYRGYCTGDVLKNCQKSCGACYIPGQSCLIKSKDFSCSGYQCIEPLDADTSFDYYDNPFCLPGDHALCQKADVAGCGGKCLCATQCQHACGRCPVSASLLWKNLTPVANDA